MKSKFSHVLTVVFALLVVFGLVGSIAAPHSVMPAAFLVFTVLGWASAKIVNEGLASGSYLYSLLRPAAEDSTDPNDQDDEAL